MKKILLASAAVVAITAAPAIAADGPYVGANVNFSTVNTDYTFDDGTDTVELDGFGSDGFGGQIVAGYRHSLNDTFSIGGEIGFGLSNADSEISVNGTSVDFKKNNAYSISVRPGVKVSDGVLGYGVLGYTQAEFEASSGGNSADDDLNGFVLGAGVEADVANGFRIRGEYNYVAYGDEEYTVGSITENYDPDESIFRVGVVKGF
jgi:outer membrane immunogenic protein